MPSLRGASVPVRLGEALTSQVRAFARDRDATLFMTLLAAFHVQLVHLSSQRDVLVGVPSAGRGRTELEGLIGYFANTLVLRGDLREDPRFDEFLDQTRRRSLTANTHQDLPFEKLVDALRPQRETSRSPLFQVMFALQNVPATELELPGLTLRFPELGQRSAKFDLSLYLWETDSAIEGYVEYATDLFDATTALRFRRGYEVLLADAVRHSGRRASELELVGGVERHQVLAEFSAGQSRPAIALCLHELIARQAARTPRAKAVVAWDAEERVVLTYAELHARATQLAGLLRSLGVAPESRVGISAERSAELVVGLLAILEAGGAYVPLDPTYPEERLATMVDDARLSVLLTQKRLAPRLPAAVSATAEVPVLFLDELPTLPASADTAPATDPDHPAYVIYTSGSTGRPKGVVNTHRGIVSRLRWMQEAYVLVPTDRVLQKTPYSFDVSVWEFFWPLMSGACLVMARPDGHRDPHYLARTIREEEITMLHFVPSMLRLFLDEDTACECGSLKRVVCSGEALPGELRDRFFELLDVPLHNLYGPTEAAVDVSYHACERGVPVPVSIGRPVFDTWLPVLDKQWRPVGIGVPGELAIGGVQLARGYHGRPGLTAERFVPDPSGGGRRLYRTGDLVRYRVDGNLEFLGRIDHQVKLHGLRIELGEVEAALHRLPGVRDAVAMVRTDAEAGSQRLVAYVAGDAAQLDGEALRKALGERLPAAMVPALFVVLESLPLTPNGKVDRSALSRQAPLSDVLEGLDSDRTSKPASSGSAEDALTAIWCEVLGLARVSADDNFFTLGGDSILGIQVVTRARRAGWELSPRDVFDHQTLGALAMVAQPLEGSRPSEASGLEEDGPVVGPVPFVPIQRWLFGMGLRDLNHFNNALLFEPRERLRVEVLRAALAALMAHHDALRLTFYSVDSQWHQVCEPPGSGGVPLVHADLSALPEERFQEAVEKVNADLEQSLDITEALAHMAYYDRGPNASGRLLWVLHHLVVDGISWGILLSDLESSYRALCSGRSPALPPKTSSFKSWTEHLQNYAMSRQLREQAGFWLNLPVEQVRAVPRDRAEGEGLRASSRWVVRTLDAEATRRLLQDVPQAFRTMIHDVLLTALLTAWNQHTGQRVLWLDLERHGREEELFEGVDLSRSVGWFTCIHPVLLSLPEEGADPIAALKAVKEVLHAMAASGLGFGVLRYLSPYGDRLAALPRAEVVFNYLGRMDTVLAPEALWRPAEEGVGPQQSPHDHRTHVLEIDASIVDECLVVRFGYSANLHHEETLQALAEGYLARLRELIELCSAIGAGGYTPSDFPLAHIDQVTLDRYLAGQTEIEDVYPATPLQRGMLFHSAETPGSGTYFERLHHGVRGGFDTAAFRRAWQVVVDRHPILRTRFAGVDDPETAHQVVLRRMEVAWQEQDWRGHDPADLDERLEADFREVSRRGFDVSTAPLLRIVVIRTAELEHRILWDFHHVLLDGWSVRLLFSEVQMAYHALVHAQSVELPAVPPFQRYIAWLGEQDAKAAEAFWRGHLAGLRRPTLISDVGGSDGPRQEAKLHGECQVELPEELADCLRELTTRRQLTLNTVVQGAWSVLIARLTGQDDVLFGATVSGRTAPVDGIDAMVGLFINTLPVRVHLGWNEPLGKALARLQERQVAVREYGHAPLHQMRAWSEVPSGTELFDHILVFENLYFDIETLEEAGGDIELFDYFDYQRTNYPLTLVVDFEPRKTLTAAWTQGAFDEVSARRLLGHWVRLLHQAAAGAADQRCGELSLMSAAERHQLTYEWNPCVPVKSPHPTLGDLFDHQAARRAEVVALVFGSDHLSYRELERRSRVLGRVLQNRGVGPEVLAGVCLDRSFELVSGMLAVLRAGGVYVPLDPDNPPERLAHLVADAQVKVFLTQDTVLERLPDAPGEVLSIDRLSLSEAQDAPLVVPGLGPDNLAYAIFTSGSTGKPKAATVAHRNAVRLFPATRTYFGYTQDDVWTQFFSCAFDVSIWEMWNTFAHGGRMVLVPFWVTRSAEAYYELACRERATVLNLSPILIAQMRDLALAEDRPRVTARQVSTGGEALDMTLMEPWFDLFGDDVPRVSNVYGLTETTIHHCQWHVRRRDQRYHRSPIGRCPGDIRTVLCDAWGDRLPIGATGEIRIGGGGVGRGYLRRPALTAARFLPDAHGQEPGGRLYRTGDLARYLPEGTLDYLGRIDHQVKIRGFRIELGEVRAALAALSEVGEAAVIVRDAPARHGTDGSKRLIGYVTPCPGASAPVARDLRTALAERLPIHMLPSAIMVLESLPVNSSGKLDVEALPEPEPLGSEQYQAPANASEELVAGIWSEILGVEGTANRRIGATDDFFALGGHSLMAVKVVSRLREVFGVEVPVRVIFESSTLRELAASVASATKGETHPLKRRQVVDGAPLGDVPLSFAQQRLWFLGQLEPESPAYNMPTALRLRGPLDLRKLTSAVAALRRRHESLRTRFPQRHEGPVQEVLPEAGGSFLWIDLRGLGPARVEAQAEALALREAQRPFDLAREALMRLHLVTVGDDDHVIFAVLHHIVSDGLSMELLVNDLVSLYAGASLAELPVQYADFALWQRSWLTGEELERQVSYWRERLAALPALLELPVDRPRPAVRDPRGGSVVRALPPALVGSLKELSQRRGTTTYMTLLAIFKALLARLTGRRDPVVGSPVAGRDRPELEGLIGFFVNTLVLRTRLAGDPSFAELLKRVRHGALEAYSHQDVPFEKLVEELEPERNRSHAPLVQVLFQHLRLGPTLVRVPELEVSGFDVSTQTAKFDLVVNMAETPDDGLLVGSWLYTAQLFDETTVRRFARAFASLAEDAIARPERPLSRLATLVPSERHQLLAEWSLGPQAAAAPWPAHVVFHHHAEQKPERVAVVFGQRSLSYRELDARARRRAADLRRQGVGAGDVVALLAERGDDFLVAMLAVWTAGGAYLPLDARHPAHRIARILASSGACRVLVQPALGELLEQALELLPEPVRPPADPIRDPSSQPSSQAQSEPYPETPTSDALAYVIYTSGSTGAPKGAMVNHRGMLNHLNAKVRDLELTAGDTVAQTASQCFDISVWQFVAALQVGAKVHIYDDDMAHNPLLLVDAVEAGKVSILETVPSLMRLVVDEIDQRSVAPRFAALHWLIPTGEALPPALARRWLERFPAVALLNAYGPTECSDDVTHHAFCEPPGRAAVRVPIGRPLASTELYVTDASLWLVPLGVTGELLVGGRGVGRGYLGDPRRTTDVFVPDPFSGLPGRRLYRTADLVRHQGGGQLDFLGRRDHQVKVRGFRIELGEIEAALLSHPGIEEAVVVARPIAGSEPALVAYVVLNGEAPRVEANQVETSQVGVFLSHRLPDYMLPSTAVVLDAMPLLPSGKVDRRALPEPSLDGLRESEHIAPRNPVEAYLVELWREMLELGNEAPISVRANFFQLGGNSIRGAVLINRLQRELDEIVHVVTLFDAPTLEELAEYLVRQHPQAVERRFGYVASETGGREETSRVDPDLVSAFRERIVRPWPATAEAHNPPAVFVLAPPRSGTTLLRIMLGGHPKLFAPPELELLGHGTLAQRETAFPGRDRFRLEGLVRTVMECRGLDAAAAQTFLDTETRAGTRVADLYGRLQGWLGEALLVDKTPSYSYHKEVLEQAEQMFDGARYVHLVRHPCAVIHSFEEAKLDQIFFHSLEGEFSRRELAELSWLVGHQNVLQFLDDVAEERQVRIRFEDLLASPKEEMERLADFLGLAFDPRMLEPYEERSRRMTDGLHAESRMLGDVKFHEHGRIDPAVADRWQGHVSAGELGEVTRLQALALGYDLGDDLGEGAGDDLEALLAEVEELSPEDLSDLSDFSDLSDLSDFPDLPDSEPSCP